MKPEIHFTPLIDFESRELNSGYCVGFTYTVRANDDLLRELLPQWIEGGKVKLIASRENNPVEAYMSGIGNVE